MSSKTFQCPFSCGLVQSFSYKGEMSIKYTSIIYLTNITSCSVSLIWSSFGISWLYTLEFVEIMKWKLKWLLSSFYKDFPRICLNYNHWYYRSLAFHEVGETNCDLIRFFFPNASVCRDSSHLCIFSFCLEKFSRKLSTLPNSTRD